MKAVVQRVASASAVTADGRRADIVGGMLVLLCVAKEDGDAEVDWMASKIATLRIFEDAEGKMNLSVQEAGGSIMIVSSFTVCGDTRKGRRPSYDSAAGAEQGEELFDATVQRIRELSDVPVETGFYGEEMQVSLVNDGPVTIIIESPRR